MVFDEEITFTQKVPGEEGGEAEKRNKKTPEGIKYI